VLTSTDITGRVADLAWAQWTALGAGGWADGEESPYSVDLEQLIALTAWISAEHPRVHAVAQAWLARYNDFIARPRLKNLLATETADLKLAVSTLLNTTATPTNASRGKITRTEVELPPLAGRRDLIALRTRAAVGVGARAEILRLLAQQPDRQRSTAWLARFSGYSKRNVADALTMLGYSGLVNRRRITNSDKWSLADAAAMRKLLGPFPRAEVRPPIQLAVLRALTRNAGLFEQHVGDAAITEALSIMESLRTEIESAGHSAA